MRIAIRLAVVACALVLILETIPAQTPPRPGGRRGPATFPAQQRQAGDPALIERGKGLYEANCRLCHGADLRGGEMGGPNLLRSQLLFNDQQGETIAPIIQGGSQTTGGGMMPAIPLSDADIRAVAEYLHSVQAGMRGQGNPPPGEEAELNILVGDATAGKAYFDATCSSCHTVADMRAFVARFPDPRDVQNFWVAGGGRGRSRTPATVTVTTASGESYTGELVRYDDFIVVMRLPDGTQRSFRRDGDQPRVEINDPADAHRKLLAKYTDKNIHDVTAYLVTLQ